MKNVSDNRKGAILSVASSAITGLAGAVSGVLVARALGPEDRGLFASLTAVPFLAMTICSLGLDDAVARAVGREELSARDATRLVWTWGLIWGVLVAVVLWPLQIWAVLDGRAMLAGTIIVSLAPAFMLTRLLNGVTLGEGRYLEWNALRTIGGISYTVAIASIFFLGSLDVLGATLAWVASYAVSLVLAASVTRYGWHQSPPNSSANVLGPLVRFGVKVGTTKVGSQLSQRADQVILALMVPLKELGVYAVASTIALSPGLVIMGYSSYVFGAAARDSEQALLQRGRMFAIRGWLLTLAVYGMVILAAPQILRYGFGAEFLAANRITQLLCAGAAVYYGTLSSVGVLNAIDRAGQAARSQTICLVITVVSLPFSISHFGTAGAAYAILLANCVNAALVTYALWHATAQAKAPRTSSEAIGFAGDHFHPESDHGSHLSRK